MDIRSKITLKNMFNYVAAPAVTLAVAAMTAGFAGSLAALALGAATQYGIDRYMGKAGVPSLKEMFNRPMNIVNYAFAPAMTMLGLAVAPLLVSGGFLGGLFQVAAPLAAGVGAKYYVEKDRRLSPEM